VGEHRLECVVQGAGDRSVELADGEVLVEVLRDGAEQVDGTVGLPLTGQRFTDSPPPWSPDA
jgi:hypothetical protein